MNLEPGEVWLADLGLAAKSRPVVIVSRSDPDPGVERRMFEALARGNTTIPTHWPALHYALALGSHARHSVKAASGMRRIYAADGPSTYCRF